MTIEKEKLLLSFIKLQLLKALTGVNMEAKNKFNHRAFTSIGMFLSGIGIPFSGLMNHLTGFDPLTVERHLWMSVHNMLGLFFVIFSVWHIKLNWKPLKNHIKKAAVFFISREAAYAVTLIAFFLMLIIIHAFHLNVQAAVH